MKKDQFGQLDFYRGFRVTIEHSKELINSAETLGKGKHFASATALYLLAAEEAVKAAYLYSIYLFPKIEFSNHKKLFSDHAFKVEGIRQIVFLAHFFEKAITLPLSEINNLNNPTEKEKVEAWQNGRKSFLKWLQSIPHSKELKLNKEMEWWKQLTSKKEDALYVRPDGKNWHVPSNTAQKRFKECQNHVPKFIELLDTISAIDISSPEFRLYRRITNNLIVNSFG